MLRRVWPYGRSRTIGNVLARPLSPGRQRARAATIRSRALCESIPVRTAISLRSSGKTRSSRPVDSSTTLFGARRRRARPVRRQRRFYRVSGVFYFLFSGEHLNSQKFVLSHEIAFSCGRKFVFRFRDERINFAPKFQSSQPMPRIVWREANARYFRLARLLHLTSRSFTQLTMTRWLGMSFVFFIDLYISVRIIIYIPVRDSKPKLPNFTPGIPISPKILIIRKTRFVCTYNIRRYVYNAFKLRAALMFYTN